MPKRAWQPFAKAKQIRIMKMMPALTISDDGFCVAIGFSMKTSKIGRPKLPKGEARTFVIRARVTPSEQRAIESAANGDGVSEWARIILVSAAKSSFSVQT